ncbi:orotate phosphoribosyltransferase [Varunaivibrio sulfuroxidans]|uniref:Orotate phosphoribosyltransferase n=1 Tax=Varunaivibrio sulfuroxidans TaxID=1773489 RepID=A0A4R3J7J2_9PROT|nr:orotate phosphoribosyltransferase [Varunaivibrio sulfuroxidans]TCS60856.1 orotate phosphoribosyltransferase [Varunaivibrio sulfuroxidans]WES31730.1 orotate phosphoribosyltransferase [Varunaivibrio sulfuroxidans]
MNTPPPAAPSNPDLRPHGAKTAKILLDIEAVNFRPQEPYVLTSGWASPVYIDCRKLISFPRERARVMEMAVDLLGDALDLSKLDAIAGGETAGIPYAAWIAQLLDKSMLYVRKKPKGFGRNAQIEGDMKEGERVLLVEDLATDGASKMLFVDALRTAGATVTDTFVVFFYGAFPGAEENLAKSGMTMHYLATWWDVLAVAERERRFPPHVLDGVRDFLTDPLAWSKAHGGK